MISVFWAVESLFVTQKCFVVNQNHWKFIEEESSSHLTYQTLISYHWWLQKLIKSQISWLFFHHFDWFLQSPVIKYQCLICQMKAGVFFNNLFIILINNKTFSVTNKASRAQKTEIMTVCLQICLIIRVTSDQISMFDMSNESWSLLQ